MLAEAKAVTGLPIVTELMDTDNADAVEEAAEMLDIGEHRTAYLIARDAALPARDIYKTEQEFTAGWIALRFLNDPSVAAQHFARIGVGSVNPTALARAGYWQGRAAEAAGIGFDALIGRIVELAPQVGPAGGSARETYSAAVRAPVSASR